MAQPSAPTSISLAIKGLYLNPSSFGDNVPKGALSVADNVVIDRPSVVATRRGFDNSFSTLLNDGARSLYQYSNTKLMNTSDNDLHVDALGNGVWTTYTGTFTVPDPTNPASRVRGLETNKNFYFITGTGTYRLDHIAGQPRPAGCPPGLSGTGAVTGITGFLPVDTNVAYRIVFGFKDFNQQLVLGAPSSRIVVDNAGATSANVDLTFQVPQEITVDPSNFFFQVYRGNASPNLITPPDDEMSLVYEDICTSTATMTISDITPDTLKGAALYTNQGQDGILQSNYRPPWAADIATFKQYTFYANTRTLQSSPITLISAGAINGVDAMIPGDTVTFTKSDVGGGAFTLTADTTNNSTTGHFAVSNTGNPALDIQITASNLALIANAYATNNFLTAYYTSSDTDLPGKLRFDRISLVSDEFTITVSRAASWEQSFPLVSTNEEKPNRIYYSKFNQTESVPLVNYVDVGSANAPINRIVPLRDGMMVLKQDGVFRISNAAPPFTVTPIDYNVRILADNTAAELDNKVYFLSDQGVVAMSDSDAQIMSFVLDRTIIQNTSPNLFPNLKNVAWGLAYQSDRKYILAMPATSTETQASQQYVHNHLTQVWTRWTLKASCAMVFKADGKMYLGSDKGTAPGVNNSYVYQERKSFTNADYADDVFASSTTSTGPLQVITIDNLVLPANMSIQPGWTVIQTTSGAAARIVSASVGATTTTLTMAKSQIWQAGAVQVFVPIISTIETVQLDTDNPGINKQFSEIVYIFTEQGFTSLNVLISSNTAGNPILDVLTPTLRGGWGIDAWGTSPWGGTAQGQGKIRRYVPQKVQRCGWLYVNITNGECFTSFGFSGFELFYKLTSSRQK